MPRRWKWEGANTFVTTVADVPGGSTVISESGFEKGETIARILGDVGILKVVASTSVVKFACGLIMLDASNASFPNPSLDFDAAWQWLMNGSLIPHDGAGDFSPVRYTIDVHGMRKVGGNDKYVFVAFGAGVALSFNLGLRFGIKLP